MLLKRIISGIYGFLNRMEYSISKFNLNSIPHRRILFTIVAIAILIRIPMLIVESDSRNIGWDAASYFELSKNLSAGEGYQIKFKELFNEVLDTREPYMHEITNKVVWMPPVYPLLGALSMKIIGARLFSLIILNTILLVISLIFFYFILKKFFSKIYVFWGALLFAIHPMIFVYSTNTMSELSYLFFSILSVWAGVNYYNSGFKKKWLFFMASVVSLSFLSRNIAVFNAFAILIWVIYLRKFRHLVYYVLITFFFWFLWEFGSSWLFYDMNVSRYLTTYFQSSHPLGDSIISHHVLAKYSLYTNYLKELAKSFVILSDIATIDFYFLLAPFVIIGMYLNRASKISNLFSFSIVIIIPCLLFVGASPSQRYYITIIPLGLILALSGMDYFKKSTFWPNIKNAILFILILTIIIYLYKDFRQVKEVYKEEIYLMGLEKNYKSLDENKKYKRIIATNPPSASFFLNIESVRLPVNVLKEETLDKIIDQYFIEAIIISKNDIDSYSNSDFILNTFYKKSKAINTPEHNLELMGQNENVWLYSTIDKRIK
jgi:hypothetical protein